MADKNNDVNNNSIEEKMLNDHGIKPTANRIIIVNALASEHSPVSMTALERQLHTIDKSGIFRTLMLFKAHHLVHAFEDGEGQVEYELCTSHGVDEDEDMHVHFYCESCHRTFCFYDTPIPSVDIPCGYEMDSINYMIKGLCPDCARKKALRG